jgi:HrpA-like RNA helicase
MSLCPASIHLTCFVHPPLVHWLWRIGAGCAVPAVADVLRSMLTPPSPDAVLEACRQLSQLGALSQSAVPPAGPAAASDHQGEVLTALGSHLAAMPMDVTLGKALLYGCMLR